VVSFTNLEAIYLCCCCKDKTSQSR